MGRFAKRTAYPIDSEKIFIRSQDFLGIPSTVDLILGSRARERSLSFQDFKEILAFRVPKNSLYLKVDIKTWPSFYGQKIHLLNDGPYEFVNSESLESFLYHESQQANLAIAKNRVYFCAKHESHPVFKRVLFDFIIKQSLTRLQKQLIIMLRRWLSITELGKVCLRR
jgi:hypothetical protein